MLYVIMDEKYTERRWTLCERGDDCLKMGNSFITLLPLLTYYRLQHLTGTFYIRERNGQEKQLCKLFDDFVEKVFICSSNEKVRSKFRRCVFDLSMIQEANICKMECATENDVAMENDDKFDCKKQILAEKLQKREEERLADIQKRKDEQSNVKSDQENAKFFFDHFTNEKTNLERELSACDSTDKNKLVEKFDALSVMYQKLQRFLTESTMFLPSYDVQQSQEYLTKLQSQIQEKREQLLPKKKFAFRAKKKGNVQEKQDDKKENDMKEEKVEDDSIVLADCKLTDLKDLDLKMQEEINKKDVALARLDSCKVKLLGTPSAIHINKLTNCTILSGPVSGSIFIRQCKDCTFVVPCQQLRIHTTTDTKFYIHVTSRAIVEDCSNVSFGPYNWTYPDIDKHYQISGLDKNRNSWNDIDDFNWLAADKHSPNWSLIPEEERTQNWNGIN